MWDDFASVARHLQVRIAQGFSAGLFSNALKVRIFKRDAIAQPFPRNLTQGHSIAQVTELT